ncbi:MAG: hypothetical protein [Wendovervirus sonii]|uniref:Uncharacterized protein n=1 Tax=phage Lak_Megaphage_Sonny TaxID=3109229 RepID=A0ABZ0Z5L3_9CAUD|nr:MAG: hypothetical protein [phage Lak_Megaphage_Sonny]
MNKKKEKEKLIFFDLYFRNEYTDWINTLLGSFSIPEKDLSDITTISICEYIKEHLSEFTEHYEFSDITNENKYFKIPNVQLRYPITYLSISNIHRV